MIMFKWRRFFCLPILAVLPSLLLAQESPSAMLRSDGTGVLVNGNSPPPATALFAGDLIETLKNGAARIEASGSAANLDPDTLVQFEGDELILEHGKLSVNTTHGLRIRVGCLTIVPENTADSTHYDVADMDGKVTISALKNAVVVNTSSGKLEQVKQSAPSGGVTVHEGQQQSRDEKCGGPKSAPVSGTGGGNIMNSPWAIGVGAVGIAILTCVALCRGPEPISPSKP
jgi:hypothetical protein